MNIIEMTGDNEFNNLFKNELKLYSDTNSKKQYENNVIVNLKANNANSKTSAEHLKQSVNKTNKCQQTLQTYKNNT